MQDILKCIWLEDSQSQLYRLDKDSLEPVLYNRQRVHYDNKPLGHIFADKSPTSSFCLPRTGCKRPRPFHYVQSTDD